MNSWILELDDLVAATHGAPLSRVQSQFTGVGTDTRVTLSGKVFFALKGDQFDAHDYLDKAVASGAGALVIHRRPANLAELQKKVSVVEVQDTLLAFQNLARFWRKRMPAKIIGLTGTNGKTTTKEFAAAIIGSQRHVQYSKGSFNNHWGVPMSILSIAPEHEVAILEMGMNHAGELKVLSHIADADVVACTMVGRGHMEGVGRIEDIAAAKAEIYDEAPASAVRLFNLDNPYTLKMYETWKSTSNHLTFSERAAADSAEADVGFEVEAATETSLTVRGHIQGVQGRAVVPTFGRHNSTNLMCAALMALSCGLRPDQIWSALPLCKGTWGRNQWVKLPSGARVLFDGYNANPESMRAAIQNFELLKAPGGGRKIAVLGEMRELGTFSSELHRELGRLVGKAGFDFVWFIGSSGADFKAGIESSGFNKTLVFSDSYELSLAPKTLPVLSQSDLLLIKGSRGVELEKALLDLKPLDFAKK